jgi:hypothetical protein
MRYNAMAGKERRKVAFSGRIVFENYLQIPLLHFLSNCEYTFTSA